MVEDEGGGGLLRVELELVAEGEADALGAQQRENLALVFQLGAGRLAEGVARAAVALQQQAAALAGVLGAES